MLELVKEDGSFSKNVLFGTVELELNNLKTKRVVKIQDILV
jgi:hypothetical protein